ncbi:MAG: IS1182 family transposase [Phycisphaerae bacterium]
MAYNFLPCDRNQAYLLPPSLRDWLPDGHLAWFVLDAVEQLDLQPLYARYRSDGIGNTAFNPTMMVALLIYAYCTGERSSRRIERSCESDVAYRVVAANQVPDHTTLSRFRKDNERHLKGLFLAILRLCAEAGLVKLGVVSLDGTKMKACQERLEREQEQAREAQREKINERENKEKETGKTPRGRKPKSPDEVSDETAKANVTDPESRIVKTRKGYEQGYNAQTVVTKEQIILAADVTSQENDQKQLHPMLEQAESNRRATAIEEKLGVALADAGYCSDENLTTKPSGDVELLVATKKDWKQRQALKEPPRPAPMTAALSATESMEQKLLTQRGRALYKLRGQTVEPVFGQIKSCRGIVRFVRRGLEAARGEWLFICTTHNILKLWRSGQAAWV